MKHAGKARNAGLKLIFWSLVALVVVIAAGVLAMIVGSFIVAFSAGLVALWALFAVFTLYFFRDPEPRVPAGPDLIVSPGHGKVDVIDETDEPEFMGGRCQRISMFLSVIDVHVQNAPISGTVKHLKYKTGKFLSALKTECSAENECVLIGLESTERRAEKLAVKLIAGVLARRIVPFVQQGDAVARGERISLIQFGSRADIYLPLRSNIKVKLGDHVVGGETILAAFE